MIVCYLQVMHTHASNPLYSTEESLVNVTVMYWPVDWKLFEPGVKLPLNVVIGVAFENDPATRNVAYWL